MHKTVDKTGPEYITEVDLKKRTPVYIFIGKYIVLPNTVNGTLSELQKMPNIDLTFRITIGTIHVCSINSTYRPMGYEK